MRKSLFLLAAAVLALSTSAQNVYTVCGDVQDLCFCWDGAAPQPTFTFIPCADSVDVGVALIFCSGNTPPVGAIRGYAGEDNTANPIPNITGGFLNLTGIQATAPAIHLEIDFQPSDQNCLSGDMQAWRFLVVAGYTAPPANGCTGTDPFCGATAVHEDARSAFARTYYANGNIHIDAALADEGVMELHDLSGRIVVTRQLNGDRVLPMSTTLGSGIYTVILSEGGQRTSERIVVADH